MILNCFVISFRVQGVKCVIQGSSKATLLLGAWYKVGPLPVISRGYNPQLPIFFRSFIGVITPFIDGSGAHLVVFDGVFEHFGVIPEV